MTSGTRAVVAFIAITYALAIADSIAAVLSGGLESPFLGVLRGVTVFLPAVAVSLYRFAFDQGPRVDWARLPPRYLPIALLLIPLVLHAAMLSATAAGGGVSWQDWLTPQADGLYHTPASRGWGVTSLSGLLVRIALNALVGHARLRPAQPDRGSCRRLVGSTGGGQRPRHRRHPRLDEITAAAPVRRR
jgi:hypothetical protein